MQRPWPVCANHRLRTWLHFKNRRDNVFNAQPMVPGVIDIPCDKFHCQPRHVAIGGCNRPQRLNDGRAYGKVAFIDCDLDK